MFQNFNQVQGLNKIVFPSVAVPISASCREATTTHRRQPARTGNRVPSARFEFRFRAGTPESESEPQWKSWQQRMEIPMCVCTQKLLWELLEEAVSEQVTGAGVLGCRGAPATGGGSEELPRLGEGYE